MRQIGDYILDENGYLGKGSFANVKTI